MPQIKKIAILIIGFAIIGAAGAAAYALHLGPFKAEDLGPVIATVDGRPVYLSEARARIEGLASVHGDVAKTLGANWPQAVLQSLVDDQIIEAETEARGITVSDSEVAVALGNVEQMFPSVTEFQKWLDSQHMDMEELERRIELQTLAARVYTAVTVDATATIEDVRGYYRSHREQYVGVDGATLPFSAVRSSIREKLDKRAKDRAYGTWLEERRRQVKVVVVMDDWWKDLS